ncbi:MAG: hypothetical protein COX65_01690 [Elusimicrobia bacterium CG_4_10_14_0_2_um_filter_56_8]|nr:MAG: hypothetical protein AUJ51_02335 [Elusimicrobia bacterium CG1_02_56_21]PJA16919.1 MAG: hypothetical protein COX65_01690 [Elusimicrobia bacterium CG_4_10_14_0_2_um_filter_56_8]
MSFMVITAGEKAPEFSILAKILGEFLKLDPASAAAAARHCWGVLGSDLEEAAAGQLAGLCADFGIPATRLPSPQPGLPPEERITKAFFENGTASFTGSGGLNVTAGPGDIIVLAAAPIKEGTLRTVKTTEGPSGQEKAVRLGIMAVTGLPIGFGKNREVKKEVKSSEMSFYLDIIFSAGPRRLRLSSDNFNFSCLKKKITYSSQLNFRLLAAELASFTPSAFKNAGLRAILEAKQLTLLPYDSLADLEKETLRLMLAAKG